MNVIIGEAAYADLDRLYDWIAQDRPSVAASVVNRILDDIERFGMFPYIGRKGRAPGTFEWVGRSALHRGLRSTRRIR